MQINNEYYLNKVNIIKYNKIHKLIIICNLNYLIDLFNIL